MRQRYGRRMDKNGKERTIFSSMKVLFVFTVSYVMRLIEKELIFLVSQ